jgi:O-antigen ligase
MIITNDQKYLSLAVYFLPIFLVTGPFLPDLLVSLSSIFFLFLTFKKKLFTYYKNIFFKIFVIFWIYITINSLFSVNILVSLKSSFFFLRFGVFSILIYYLISTNKKFLKFFSYVLFFTFAVVLIDSYIQFFFGSNILGMTSPNSNRLSSFFGEEMIVGSFLSRLLPLILALGIFLFEKKIKKIGLISFWFIILADIIIFLSGERTSFFFLIVTNFLYILYVTKFKLYRFLALIISFICIIFIVSSNKIVKERMINETIDSFFVKKIETETVEKKITIFTSVHQSHYETALKMFYDKPFFGVGPNMFRYECSNTKYATGNHNCTTHPHNTHVQILSELGIFGYLIFIIPFISLVFFFVKKSFLIFTKKSSREDYVTCLAISFFLTLFPFAPSGNFFHNWLCIIVFLPVGFLLYAQNLKKKHGL